MCCATTCPVSVCVRSFLDGLPGPPSLAFSFVVHAVGVWGTVALFALRGWLCTHCGAGGVCTGVCFIAGTSSNAIIVLGVYSPGTASTFPKHGGGMTIKTTSRARMANVCVFLDRNIMFTWPALFWDRHFGHQYWCATVDYVMTPRALLEDVVVDECLQLVMTHAFLNTTPKLPHIACSVRVVVRICYCGFPISSIIVSGGLPFEEIVSERCGCDGFVVGGSCKRGTRCMSTLRDHV